MNGPQYRSTIIDPDQTTWRVQSARKWRGPVSDHPAFFADADETVTVDGTTCAAMITEHDDLSNQSVGSMSRVGAGRYATIHVLVDSIGYTCSASTDERGAW